MRTSDQTMTTFRSFAGSSVTFLQPSIWKSIHELKEGDRCIATLEFTSVLKGEAKGACDEGTWIIKQSGIWKPNMTVREERSGKTVAEIPVSFLKSEITFTLPDRNHETLTLQRNVWSTRYTLTGRMGHELIRLDMKPLALASGTMTLGPRAEAYNELPWLVFLVCYMAATIQRAHTFVHVS